MIASTLNSFILVSLTISFSITTPFVSGNIYPRVPVVCTKSSSSSCSNGGSITALNLSGGGMSPIAPSSSSLDYDSDNELLTAFAEDSDIFVEIRGGSNGSASTLQPRPQPLRISTYRKGIRQLRISERRERRMQKRLRKLERRQIKKEENDSHKVIAKTLKVGFVVTTVMMMESSNDTF